MDYRLSRLYSIINNKKESFNFGFTIIHHSWITDYFRMMKPDNFSVHKSFRLGKSQCDQFSSSCFSSLYQSSWSVSRISIHFKFIIFISREKVSDIFELLIQINAWLEQMKNDDLYIDGIREILQVKLPKLKMNFF